MQGRVCQADAEPAFKPETFEAEARSDGDLVQLTIGGDARKDVELAVGDGAERGIGHHGLAHFATSVVQRCARVGGQLATEFEIEECWAVRVDFGNIARTDNDVSNGFALGDAVE